MGGVGCLDEQLGQEARDLGPPRAVQQRQPRPQCARPEPGRHRPVDQRPFGGVTAGLRDDRALTGTPGPEVLGQAGLSDARFAREQHELGSARDAGPPDVHQLPPFARFDRPAVPDRRATPSGRLARGTAAPRRRPGSPPTGQRPARLPARCCTRGRCRAPAPDRHARRADASACGSSAPAADRRGAAARPPRRPRRARRCIRRGRPARPARRGSARAVAADLVAARGRRARRAGHRGRARPRAEAPSGGRRRIRRGRAYRDRASDPALSAVRTPRRRSGSPSRPASARCVE